jgi:hypothetical protein
MNTMTQTNRPYRPHISPTRIIICARCQGRGNFRVLQDQSDPDAEDSYITTPCECCRGSGRMISTLTIRPYPLETAAQSQP